MSEENTSTSTDTAKAPDVSTTKGEPTGTSESHGEDKKPDFRAEFFKEKKKSEKTEAENSALLKTLERNNDVMDRLASLLAESDGDTPKKSETGKKDDDAGDLDWLFKAESNEATEKTPTEQPLTRAELKKAMEDYAKTLRTEFQTDSTAAESVRSIEGHLNALFQGEDRQKKFLEARERIFNTVKNTGLSAAQAMMIDGELAPLVIDKMRDAAADEAKEQLKKELVLKMAQGGVDPVALGLQEAVETPAERMSSEAFSKLDRAIEDDPSYLRRLAGQVF